MRRPTRWVKMSIPRLTRCRVANRGSVQSKAYSAGLLARWRTAISCNVPLRRSASLGIWSATAGSKLPTRTAKWTRSSPKLTCSNFSLLTTGKSAEALDRFKAIQAQGAIVRSSEEISRKRQRGDCVAWRTTRLQSCALSLCFSCHAFNQCNPLSKSYSMIFQAETAIRKVQVGKIGAPASRFCSKTVRCVP